MNAAARSTLLGAALLTASCVNPLRAIEFERMIDQPRGKPYKASPYFDDGRLMRQPPPGTVPIDEPLGPPALVSGVVDNAYVAAIPVPVTRARLERGRDRFELFCATCHGLQGDGRSVVAHNMELRPPPSLVDEPVRSFPPGRLFEVMSEGYGLMPSYASALSVDERWSVVAYLRALELSAHAELAKLPPAVRAQAEEALR